MIDLCKEPETTFFPSRQTTRRLEGKSVVVLDVEEATGRPRLVAALHVAPNPRNGLFVSNNPVNAIDPLGLTVFFPEGYDPSGLFNYLRQSQDASHLLDHFGCDKGPHVRVIFSESFNHDANRFEYGNIIWNPNAELSFGNRGFNSPELNFLHELVHAYHLRSDPADYLRNLKDGSVGPRWRNAEEKRTIERVNITARILGETVRAGYGGGHYRDRRKSQQ